MTTNFNENHPELKPGERFYENRRQEEAEKLLQRFTTARIGEVAYHADGRTLVAAVGAGMKDFVPVFVNDKEYLLKEVLPCKN